MPTPSELSLALTHGMKACAQALTNAPTQIIANDGQDYNISNGALNNTGSGAQFCIAQ
jgi:chaperonin GroEL (HSP60 family)